MHKKITEYQAKCALYDTLSLPQLCLEVADKNKLSTLANEHPWLQTTNLVAKPDIGIGQRAKKGLLSLKNDWPATRDWIDSQWDKELLSSRNKRIALNRFLIEEYVPHGSNEEYYISIQTTPEKDILMFGETGGILIEDNWEQIQSIEIDLNRGLQQSDVTNLLQQSQFLVSHEIDKVSTFILNLYRFFVEWSFAELEINPLVIRKNNIYVLDLKAKIDTDAYWQNRTMWQKYDFMDEKNEPQNDIEKTEKYIRELDSASGSSLKCQILNPNGSIWPLTAGGGASIVVMDALERRGLINEVGFYGEYSGGPDHQLMQAYTEKILENLLSAKTHQPKYLLIFGATANFTDVKETFKGIIKALESHANQLAEQQVTVFVRRGGPNQEEGLQHMEDYLTGLGLPHSVCNPETGLTELIWNI